MRNPDGSPHTAHTTVPVPCILVPPASDTRAYQWRPVTPKFGNTSGSLADIAPTILALMGIEKPDAMTGENLLN